MRQTPQASTRYVHQTSLHHLLHLRLPTHTPPQLLADHHNHRRPALSLLSFPISSRPRVSFTHSPRQTPLLSRSTELQHLSTLTVNSSPHPCPACTIATTLSSSAHPWLTHQTPSPFRAAAFFSSTTLLPADSTRAARNSWKSTRNQIDSRHHGQTKSLRLEISLCCRKEEAQFPIDTGTPNTTSHLYSRICSFLSLHGAVFTTRLHPKGATCIHNSTVLHWLPPHPALTQHATRIIVAPDLLSY